MMKIFAMLYGPFSGFELHSPVDILSERGTIYVEDLQGEKPWEKANRMCCKARWT